MPGSIDFKYNEKLDIIVAIPHWSIETVEDCKVWNDEWVSYLKKFGRKVDCIMILDDFKVESEISPQWGVYRANINKEYIRYGFRVNPSILVSLYVKASGIQYNAASAEAATYEDAVTSILNLRKST